ncbi:hypothetical protein EVAR_12759_1 [Eumeta japonica]|uniref:Uncharacterized protein n=1 Tax=Eumeta variegata TaxID=151549 RepID=A0A4C1UAY2_EUMVA|nr:hypothetical protein EVAR_12759_1 [Eumeta japonica]
MRCRSLNGITIQRLYASLTLYPPPRFSFIIRLLFPSLHYCQHQLILFSIRYPTPTQDAAISLVTSVELRVGNDHLLSRPLHARLPLENAIKKDM